MNDALAYHEIDSQALDAIKAAVRRYGVIVEEDWDEPEGGRFIGTIRGRTIILFPKYDHPFAIYFTVAHLYGHLVQLVRGGDQFRQAVDLVYRVGQVLTHAEVEAVWAFELEAAAIGRRLMAELGPISSDLDGQYARYFLADFHYLIHFLETGEQGVELFEKYLRRQPIHWSPIAPDPRPLLDCSGLEHTDAADVVVV